ncbi:FabD/lysophospholipase-like protein [Ceratobasidium sp. AG-I]|nr:FabD/lysophospholipase-like protein [Ceratobasidium sp. AG-I]
MNNSRQARVQDAMISVLSLDGGGIRGLSSLLILQEVMKQVTGIQDAPIYPWKYFTVICGTSTGGLIALMLGRLRMSIEAAIKAYVRLGQEIFEPKKWIWKEGRYKASNLEKAIQRIVGQAQNEEATNGQPDKTPKKGLLRKLVPKVLDKDARAQKKADEANEEHGESVMLKDNREDGCKTFVCSMTADNLSQPTHFRSYDVSANATPDCKIWEAARATSAAPYFFKPMLIKENGIPMTYVDGGLRCNNPTRRLIKEMRTLGLSGHPVCFLSIGTGQGRTINIPKVGGVPKYQLRGVSKALRKIATDCEAVERDLAEDFADGTRPGDVYVRLNVEQGMQGMGLEEWKKNGKIQSHTNHYMREVSVQAEVNKLINHLRKRPECE